MKIGCICRHLFKSPFYKEPSEKSVNHYHHPLSEKDILIGFGAITHYSSKQKPIIKETMVSAELNISVDAKCLNERRRILKAFGAI